MSIKSCKRPTIIKNKFISTLIGTFGILMGLGFILPISNFSVYITSYINEKQKFVTMHYGFFINLIFGFSMTIGRPIGGFLELKIGFILTSLTGIIIILAANFFFLNVQNIWLCYVLTFLSATGTGIAVSLVGKNIALYKPNKKGVLTGLIGSMTFLLAGILSVVGEKIINPKGEGLKTGEEFYAYEYSSRTYLYFLIGFFTIPVGTIIFILFIVEYKKNDESEIKKDNDDDKLESEKTEEKKEESINVENINEENIIEEENKDNKEKQDVTNNDKKEEENKEMLLEKEIKEMSMNKKIKKVIKTFRFWRIALVQLFLTFAFSFILGTGRTFGALIGIDGNALQFLMLCQTGALILIGPVLGIIVDKKGPLFLLRITTLGCMVPCLLLAFFTKNTVIFISSFALAILSLVSTIVSFAPFVMEVYGIEESVILEGIMGVFSKLSEVTTTVSAFVISFFYSTEEIVKPYKLMYLIGAGVCLLSFILLIFEKKEKFDYNEKEEDLGTLVEKGRFTEVNV